MSKATPPRARRRTVLLVTLTIAVVAAVGVSATFLLGRNNTNASAEVPPLSGKLVEVRRDTLTEKETLTGRLGYLGKHDVFAGGGGGILTFLPKPGDVLDRGATVYAINDLPIPLLLGDKPFWRELKLGMDRGTDVRLLEENLKALGYSGFTVDDKFDAGTQAAVKKWQKKLGVPQTGTIDLAAAVVAPGPLRVAELTGSVGGPAQGKLFSATGTTRSITVDVPVEKQSLAKVDAEVEVLLPGGKTAKGKITSVGTVAVTRDGDRGGNAKSVIEVQVALIDPAAAGTLDAARVDVGFTSNSKENVLIVPVGALLALPGGGYAVEVVDGAGGTRNVTVELGMFANGQVEVTSPDLREGLKVKVAGI